MRANLLVFRKRAKPKQKKNGIVNKKRCLAFDFVNKSKRFVSLFGLDVFFLNVKSNYKPAFLMFT